MPAPNTPILSAGSWKTGMARRGFLPTAHRFSKRNPIVLDPLPGSFINQARLTLIRNKKKKKKADTTPRQTLSQYLFILLRAHLSFLKILYFHLKGFSFLTEMVFNPEFWATSELLIFPWAPPMNTWGRHTDTFVFLLLICLFLQRCPLRTQRVRGKFLFFPYKDYSYTLRYFSQKHYPGHICTLVSKGSISGNAQSSSF